MRIYILTLFLGISGIIGGCQLTNQAYYISLKSNFKGWIYLVKSADKLGNSNFYPDSFGIIYIPSQIYNSKFKFFIRVDDTLAKAKKFQLYHSDFYDEKNNKVTYSKFYFPFTTDIKDVKLYLYDGKKLPEFEYLYYTGKLDKRRLMP